MESTDGVEAAHQAWAAAFRRRRNAVEADAALSVFPVASWTAEQLLELGKLVFHTLDSMKDEAFHPQEGFKDVQSNFASAEGDSDEDDEEESDEEDLYIDELLVGVCFSDLLCCRAGNRPELLRKLLLGIATEWECTDVSRASDTDCSEFPMVLDMWYQQYPDLEAATALASALIMEDKWGPENLQEIWAEQGGEFDAVWKAFTIPELGKLFQTAVRNGRSSSRSYDESDSGSDLEEDRDSGSGDFYGEEFEEEVKSMFYSLCEILEFNPVQQKELLLAGGKGVFYPETLYHLNDDFDLNLTSEEWAAFVKKESPAMEARAIKELLEEEAYWCGDSPPRFPTQRAYSHSTCPNDAKRGCLRQQCAACCKQAPEGPCVIHRKKAVPSKKTPAPGPCVDLRGARPSGSSASFAPPQRVYVPPYVEPIYTGEEIRVVSSTTELENLLQAGRGVPTKKIVFRDFYVTTSSSRGWLVWSGGILSAWK